MANGETKPVLKSKLNWAGITLLVIGLLGAITQMDWTSYVQPEVASIITAALGGLIFYLRTWRTSKKIG